MIFNAATELLYLLKHLVSFMKKFAKNQVHQSAMSKLGAPASSLPGKCLIIKK